MDIKSAEFRTKENKKLPKGAKILSKDTRISVEEIENGYIICKNTDVKYQLGKENNYEYITKKWFSKENPLKALEGKKSLADEFE